MRTGMSTNFVASCSQPVAIRADSQLSNLHRVAAEGDWGGRRIWTGQVPQKRTVFPVGGHQPAIIWAKGDRALSIQGTPFRLRVNGAEIP
jgi:hypothetical protein